MEKLEWKCSLIICSILSVLPKELRDQKGVVAPCLQLVMHSFYVYVSTQPGI